MPITTAVATRQGTSENNADGSAVFRSERGEIGAAVIDLAGHHPRAPFTARLLAETAARIAPQRGSLAALCTAGLLVADAGVEDQPEPDGVAVCARTAGTETRIAWIGDSHAYAWDGTTLTRLTTPHTWGEQARQRFDIDVPDLNDVLATSLALATPATVLTVHTQAPLVILASDGIDTIAHDDLAALVTQHAGDPQALADAIVAAAPVIDDYRDDTTVIVIHNAP